MKRMMFCGIALMLTSAVSFGAEGRTLRSLVGPALFGQATPNLPAPLSPVPDPAYSASYQPYSPSQPMPSSVVGTPIVGQPVELFSDVRYRAVRNIACDAVPTIIQFADPCNKYNCCKNCVFIQVCMPPCDPKCVKVSRDGDVVRYEFGKYAVTVRSVGDHIVVRYHD